MRALPHVLLLSALTLGCRTKVGVEDSGVHGPWHVLGR